MSLGRKKEHLSEYYQTLSSEGKQTVKTVTIDMASTYINATVEHIPYAHEKIAFDRFHVAKILSEAVDKVRYQEHETLTSQGQKDLTGTKHVWLTNRANMSVK